MKKPTTCIGAFLTVMFIGGLISSGCATSPVAEPEPIESPAEPSEPSEKPMEEPEETVEEPAQPEQEEAQTEEPGAEFEVTEEVYNKTFSDVEDLINELNGIISSRSYSKWLSYLTTQYKQRYSDPAVLAELSNQPTLKEYDIRLRTLEDYFRYVVVPSRSEVRLDDIIFTDEEHVKAIMKLDDRQAILYRLRLVDGKWKIGLAK